MSISLPDQDFYRLADVTPAASTLAGVLDAIYGATWTGNDYRGTALPAAYQWSVGRYQNAGTTEAVYLTPPSGTAMTRGMKILLAGAAAAGSAAFETDTFLASALMAGVAVNPGAYNAWNAAAPFTSGGWAGFNRAAATAINSTGTTIRPYVGKEIVVFDIRASEGEKDIELIAKLAARGDIIIGGGIKPADLAALEKMGMRGAILDPDLTEGSEASE